MSSPYTYTYDPNAWHPVLAGAVAGGIAALMGSALTLLLKKPDEVIVNSFTVTIIAIILGAISGSLWRRIRLTAQPIRLFAWTMAGGFVVAMMAISFGNLFLTDNLVNFATPIAALIFLTLGFFVPVLAKVAAPNWIGYLVIVIAIGVGFILIGQGDVVSEDLSLPDLASWTSVHKAY